MNRFKRQGSVYGFQVAAGLLIVGLAVIFSGVRLSWFEQPPTLAVSAVYSGRLQHPAQVIRIGDQYVAGELFANRIMAADTVEFDSALPVSLDDGASSLQLASPHFMQALDEHRLLVSEGWGSGIIIADIQSGVQQGDTPDRQPGLSMRPMGSARDRAIHGSMLRTHSTRACSDFRTPMTRSGRCFRTHKSACPTVVNCCVWEMDCGSRIPMRIGKV